MHIKRGYIRDLPLMNEYRSNIIEILDTHSFVPTKIICINYFSKIRFKKWWFKKKFNIFWIFPTWHLMYWANQGSYYMGNPGNCSSTRPENARLEKTYKLITLNIYSKRYNWHTWTYVFLLWSPLALLCPYINSYQGFNSYPPWPSNQRRSSTSQGHDPSESHSHDGMIFGETEVAHGLTNHYISFYSQDYERPKSYLTCKKIKQQFG